MSRFIGLLVGIIVAVGISGQAFAAFDYGNLHLVAIEDNTPHDKHDTSDGTYEYHYDLGDFNVLPTGTGPGQQMSMVDAFYYEQVDTGMTLEDFDTTSWGNVFFGAYGQDALWYNGVEYPTIAGPGIAFTSACPITSENLGSASGAALIGLIDGTKGLDAGQVEMSDVSASYLKFNSDPEVGNYNDAVNIPGAFWNAELQGLGDLYLYGFDKRDKTTLASLGTFTLSEDTDGSLLVDWGQMAPWPPPPPPPIPIPGAVWLLGSGLIGLWGIRRRRRS